MSYVFGNLKLLFEDMKDKQWVIDAFDFSYKKKRYVVLVKRIEAGENPPPYSLVKLEFLNEKDFSESLVTYANSVRLLTDIDNVKNFFGVENNPNSGDFETQFYNCLAEFIPDSVSNNKTQIQKKAMVSSLSKSDSEDPNKIYCYAVRRNAVKQDGALGQRSPFNDNKTKILRPVLYDKLLKETNLSFMYSTDPNDLKSDGEIIANWIKNKNK
ncbi:DUF6037 family protein [Candidatus Enterococcus leclercqii]|uniref:DUF6037 family protein n=1 Tax=Candidatus Enterococcus leclercqii TaxID=1857218 RepID=UPI00137A076C|nr:DUF6037 family protein [Enterococcus sp. CU9D]KAF1290200.1 hypothetical protein BAU14_03305 [Enterococcus sp. CU9D]